MVFFILGIIFLMASLLFLIFPKAVSKIDELFERLLFADKEVITHHLAAGIFFLICSILMFVYAYWVDKWRLSEFLKSLFF